MTPELRAKLEGDEPEKPAQPVRHWAVTSEPLTQKPFEELRTRLHRQGFSHPLLTKKDKLAMPTTIPSDEPRRRNRRVNTEAAPEITPPPVEQQTPTIAASTDPQVQVLKPDEERLKRYAHNTFRVGQVAVGVALIVGSAHYVGKTVLYWKHALKGPVPPGVA